MLSCHGVEKYCEERAKREARCANFSFTQSLQALKWMKRRSSEMLHANKTMLPKAADFAKGHICTRTMSKKI